LKQAGAVDAGDGGQRVRLQAGQGRGRVEQVLVACGRLNVVQAFIPENGIAALIGTHAQLETERGAGWHFDYGQSIHLLSFAA